MDMVQLSDSGIFPLYCHLVGKTIGLSVERAVELKDGLEKGLLQLNAIEPKFSKRDIIEARKEGIRFAVELARKHGTAKTFSDRIKKELE